MVLNPEICHFMLFRVKDNEQLDLICNGVTLKYNSQEKMLVVTTDNKHSFDEHIINTCKTTNKNLKGNIIVIHLNLPY